MRGVGPPSRAWEARVIAVIRHPQTDTLILPCNPVKRQAAVDIQIKTHCKILLSKRYCDTIKIMKKIMFFIIFFCIYGGVIAQHQADKEIIDRYVEKAFEIQDNPHGEPDYAAALVLFQKAAEHNHAEAVYMLGVYAMNGLACPQDEQRAFEYFKKAAELGSVPALFTVVKQGYIPAFWRLGSCLYHGIGVKQNYEAAAELFRAAAEYGEPNAQNYFGICAAKGHGVPQNDEAAVFWYRKAAEQGLADAQNNLGYRYSTGWGIEQSNEYALQWFRKAAEQEHDTAQYNLASLYFEGKGTAKDYEQAVYWYTKAAAHNNSDALNSLGICYEKGMGVPRNTQKALTFYRQAIEYGSREALHNLGMCYYYGSGVAKNKQEAFSLFIQAVNAGYMRSAYYAAGCYYTGAGTEKDMAKAIELYSRGAQHGDTDCQFQLAVMYKQGNGVPQDDERAFAFLVAALRGGYPAGESYSPVTYTDIPYYLNGKHESQDYTVFFNLCSFGAARDNPESCFYLADMYRTGKGTAKDNKKALELFTKALENGYDRAAPFAAMYYTSYEDRGFPHDYEKALELYSITAAKNDPHSCNQIGCIYRYGWGTVPKNEAKALEYFLKAFDAGDTTYAAFIAEYYYHGLGTVQDYKKAFDFYLIGAEESDADSQFELAGLYFRGEGTEKNETAARRWYQSAADAGHEEAKKILKQFK